MTNEKTTDSAVFDNHAPFGYYDHFNDTLYRGPLALVEAEKARIGGNKVTTLFDMSSADCLLARRVMALQAKLDEVMLEYCPEEMTTEQIAEWERHQAVHNAEITGAL